MRQVVILLFVVPQVVSLLLCCCAFGAKSIPVQDFAKSAPAACDFCCHKPVPADKDREELERPAPGCPCRQMMVSLMVGTPGTLETGTTIDPIQTHAMISFVATPTIDAPILAPAKAGEQAFHPPDHRQRYHHVLRC